MYRLVEAEVEPAVLEVGVEPLDLIEEAPAVESDKGMVGDIPELATSVEVADSTGTVLSSDNTGA